MEVFGSVRYILFNHDGGADRSRANTRSGELSCQGGAERESTIPRLPGSGYWHWNIMTTICFLPKSRTQSKTQSKDAQAAPAIGRLLLTGA